MDKSAFRDFFSKFESDKCQCYFDIYYEALTNLSEKKHVSILEIGVYYGNSSKAIYEYLTSQGCVVNYYGIDVVNLLKTRHFDTSFVKLFLGSQSDLLLLNQVKEDCNCFDLIIDDGSHIVNDIIASFSALKESLNIDSYYIIEDTNMTIGNTYGIIAAKDQDYHKNYILKYNPGKRLSGEREKLNQLLMAEIQNVEDINNKSVFSNISAHPSCLVFKTNSVVRGYDIKESNRAPQLIFDGLKLKYLPICKVATNSILGGLREMLEKTSPMSTREKMTKKYYVPAFSRFRLPDPILFSSYELEKIRKEYFTFAFVRNPWQRAAAAYKELLRRYPFGALKLEESRGLRYSKIYSLMNNDSSFESFVKFITEIEPLYTDTINAHWMSQSKALYLDENSILYKNFHEVELNIKFIGRMENLQEDFDKVLEGLGMERFVLPFLHRSDEYDYRQYYTSQQLKDSIAEYYKDDIKMFGYTFE